jgi:hypothetical protein
MPPDGPDRDQPRFPPEAANLAQAFPPPYSRSFAQRSGAHRGGSGTRTGREVEAGVVEAARLLSLNGEWNDRSKARSLYDSLKARLDRYLANALVLRVINGDDMRLRV